MNLVLWAAFLFSVVMYHALVVGNILPAQPSAQGELLSYIFLFLGIFQLLVIVNLDIFLIARPRRIKIGGDVLQGQRPQDDPVALAAQMKAAYYRRLFILMCALAETIGIYGLLVYLLGGGKMFAHALMGIAYLSLIYIWLRARASWEAMYLE